MTDLLSTMARHGYALTFTLLFAEAIGLPFPAAIALVAAGAAIASHTLPGPGLLLSAMVALMIGDTAQYWLGRYTGWALLGLLCRLSVNPETCILRSAESFYKRGKMTLVIAKFIPGINTMAAPLAGSMNMRFAQFFRLDLAGAVLYTVTYLLVGYISRDFLAAVLNGFHAAGRAMEFILIALCREYRCRNSPRAWRREMRSGCRSSTCAATAITTSGLSALQARSALNLTISRKRSSIFPKTRTFISTALERAKRPAPGWRIYCRKEDSTRSSSSAALQPGGRPGNHWSLCRKTIW